jgi:hypothetical protein
MNFNEKEPPYKNPELVWFELSLEVIEPKKQQNNTNLFLPGKKSTCFCYELDLLIHIRTDSCIVDGKQLKFGIQKAFLELFFVRFSTQLSNSLDFLSEASFVFLYNRLPHLEMPAFAPGNW